MGGGGEALSYKEFRSSHSTSQEVQPQLVPQQELETKCLYGSQPLGQCLPPDTPWSINEHRITRNRLRSVFASIECVTFWNSSPWSRRFLFESDNRTRLPIARTNRLPMASRINCFRTLAKGDLRVTCEYFSPEDLRSVVCGDKNSSVSH